MEIEIATVSGYDEVGRQMTAVRLDDDVVVFDMGLDLGKVLLHDDVRPERMHSLDLIEIGAIPDDRVLGELGGQVQAIVPTHGHLDHIAAIPKQAHRYDAPVVGTPMTIELVAEEFDDERRFDVDVDLVRMDAGERMQIADGVELEFVHVTHSIPGAINPVLHTPEGAIVYGLDKRIDHTPVIEDPIDMPRFRALGREGVLAYFEECTNANREGRTPSEAVARQHLRDVLYSVEDFDGGVLATTFSSHVSRVRSIVEFAREIGRQPLLLGRSMETYSGAAERTGHADFADVSIYGHGRSIQRALERVMREGKGDFLPIVTGHQGEPRATLTRIAKGETPYDVDPGDKVVYAARVLPAPTNVAQRHRAEELLRRRGARIYDDVHVSGHLSREGHYEMLRTLNPTHLIPAHGELERRSHYVDMALDEGYVKGRDLHVATNGERVELT